MNTQRVPNWLAKRSSLTPTRICLVDGDVTWTFQDLNNQAQKTARRLYGLGIREGDFVAVLLTNSFRMPQIIYALQYLGAVIVLLNNRLTTSEINWQIQDSRCKWLIYDFEFSVAISELTAAIANLKTLSYGQLEQVTETVVSLPSQIDLDALHTIIYTSGTTGRPKGVMLTNGNHWWSAMGSALNLGTHMNDKWLICVPMFHMSGLSIILRSVIYGIPMIIQHKFQPEAVNQAIQNEAVTIVSVVSSMLARMLKTLGGEGYPEEFRCMLVGGGPVPQNMLQQCREKRIPVYQTYGLTETASQFVTLSPEYMDSKLGSAGKSLFMSELKIEEQGQEKAPGEIGEIVVRGPSVAKGYLNKKDENLNSGDGWFHTGDVGYLDEDGFLYVVDRRSDLIISGGENVYPAEIEAVLTSHPLILEAGVIGIADEQWGHVPVAFVTIERNFSIREEEIQDFCRKKLARYKCPKHIYFIDKLPRNASNKLVRRELSKWIC